MDHRVARIVDANFNRAREALRVMEEYARFVLDDSAGCEAVKNLRHQLAQVIQKLPEIELLKSRDTPNDVGTRISAPSEITRATTRDVFTAAAKRLPEALRSIEEYVKTVDPEVARHIESIRYESYTAEQRIALRGERAARFGRCRLYVIITAALCKGDWLETAGAAMEGGADCLQLREKGIEDRELLERARRLAALCRERDVLFIMNDRPDLAVLADADGVHLGQTDLAVREARRIVGADRLIGVSTHNSEQLRSAVADQPDYIAVGPMFPSNTKARDLIPGPDLLRLASRETKVPIVPIGGITLVNMNRLLSAGARRLCVCSGVIAASDPASAAKAYLDGIHSNESQRG